MVDDTQKYDKIWVSDFFHSFPHLNRHLSKIDSEFDPKEDEYLESLVIWALIPVAFCIALWLFYFIYFMCRCCDKPVKHKKGSSICPRVTTGLFIFFGVGLLTFGLYENEEAHRGVHDVCDSMRDINRTLRGAEYRLNTLSTMAEDVSVKICGELLDGIAKFDNITDKQKLVNLVKKIQSQANKAQIEVDKIDLTDEFDFDTFENVISKTDDGEYYRWMGSAVVHSLYIFIFFLTLIGLLIRSRNLLIVATSLCVLCFVFLWTCVGAHLGTIVGLGDLCIDPDTYVISLASDPAEKAAITAYVKCANTTDPYGDDIQAAIKALTQAQLSSDNMAKTLKVVGIKVLDKPLGELNDALKYSLANFSILLDNVGLCPTLNNFYEEALNGACVDTIVSIALITLAGCVVGMCCVLLIISNSMLWRHYNKKRQPTNYGQVDDTDPFLPRPPPYESDYGAVGYSSPTPWSERGTLQRYSESPYSDESLMMLPNTQRHTAPLPVDESPPPAYHPGRFVRQYAASDNP